MNVALKLALTLLAICVVSTQGVEWVYTKALRKRMDLSGYHTTEELADEFEAMAERCPQLQTGWEINGDVRLQKVIITGPGDQKKMKALYFFGEHARELISPESALGFAKLMCGELEPRGDFTQADIDYALQHLEIAFFPNINPQGRMLVEGGEYCQRVNENGVDLNRNWDAHWSATPPKQDTYPGTEAFSEPETQILRSFATKYRPHMFLTIHSGTLGMYTPFAYSQKTPKGPNERVMLEILEKLNPNYCSCSVGAAGKEVGYLCPGTCLDYIYDDLGADYSFAVEIFDGGLNNYKGSWTEKNETFAPSCFLEAEEHTIRPTAPHRVATSDHENYMGKRGQVLLEVGSSGRTYVNQAGQERLVFPHPSMAQTRGCLNLFNPTDVELYKDTVSSWAQLYVLLASDVVKHHHTQVLLGIKEPSF